MNARERPVFLRAAWRNLLFLNFEVEPDILGPHVPDGTILDSFEGRTYVSAVAFRFEDTSVFGIRVPLHTDFDEINLRFYVRREVGGEVRRGVVFIKEIVPLPAIAMVARLLYGERYVALPTGRLLDLRDGAPTDGGRVGYAWRRGGRWEGLSATAIGDPSVPPEDALESFITEHYWGYARQNGRTAEYHVEHPRWRVWRGETPILRADVAGLWGAEFREALLNPPASTFLADGSAVLVRLGTPLR